MKKALRIFFSLLIVVAAVSMIFSVNVIETNAAEGNVDNPTPGGVTVQNGGPSTGTVFLYKVTVYVDFDRTATKESDISQYEVKKSAYFGRDFGNIKILDELHARVGGKTKFEYANNPYTLSATTLSEYYNNGMFFYKSDLPRVGIATDGQLGNANDEITKYFAGTNNKNCFKYAREIYPGLKEGDTWILIVEPTVRTVINGSYYYYYTPTEYAVALNCSNQDGYYNSFEGYNFTLRGHGLTLNKSGSLASMKDGTWLGMGSNKKVTKSWILSEVDAPGKNGKKDGVISEAEFQTQNHNFVKYAGVFVWFSGAFENSDFTLADGGSTNTEKFEEEEITLSTVVNRTNPGKAGTVNATLELKDYGISGAEIKDSATKSVSFAQGEKTKTVSWKVKVGSYGDRSTNRSYNYNVKIAPAGETVDLDMNNNTLTGTITLKRDLQVTKVSLNKGECFENENVKVTFSVKNANPYKAYSDVPVTIYFTYGGRTDKIGETNVTLGKSATKSGSCTINVGCVTDNTDQNDTVTVVLNSYNVSAESGRKYSEPVMSNNKGAVGIKVKRDINLSVSIVDREAWEDIIGNAPSKVKNTGSTQAVTTCAVRNNSRFNLYSTDPMKDLITVTFYVNNKKIGSQTVDVPRYGSNLVWFKWDVPEGSSVTLRAEMSWNVDQENSPDPHKDNSVSLTKAVKTVHEFDTPDTKLLLEQGSNKNYMTASGYSRFRPSVAKWSQWICDDKGTFTRIDYAMTGDSALTLTPMVSAEYYEGNTIASGSAISAVFSYTVRTECSEAGYSVSEDDYTYAQNVVAMFPEFQYSSSGDCRTMYLVGKDGNLKNASFEFEENPYVEDKQRVHFTPSNMPDGEYKVGVVASQMWTPAGPIYVNAASSLMINGTIYGDWSPNASVKG